MTNKKKIIMGSSVAAVVLLGIGAFAYLSDTDTDYDNSKVGTVDVSLTEQANGKKVQITHSDDLDNINPGDNDPTNPDDNRPGTDHELTFEIQNDGTKSVITRTIITVSGVDKDGNDLSIADLEKVILSEKADATEEASDNDKDKDDGKTIVVLGKSGDSKDGKGVVYIIGNRDSADGISDVINGTGDNKEEEDNGVTGPVRRTFDIGLAKEVTKDSPLMGATLKFQVEVQAMQYRNTGDDDWDTIFVDYADMSIAAPATPAAPTSEAPETPAAPVEP